MKVTFKPKHNQNDVLVERIEDIRAKENVVEHFCRQHKIKIIIFHRLEAFYEAFNLFKTGKSTRVNYNSEKKKILHGICNQTM